MADERRLLWRIAAFMAVITAVSAMGHTIGPHFTRQPQNTTINIDSTVEKVELECDAEGTATINYYWTKDGDNITLSEDIYLTNGRLTINNPTREGAEGWYQCFASNQIGVVMSKPAYLAFAFISDFPRESPPDVTFTEYEGGCIDCGIGDHYPGVNVLWFKDGRPLTITASRQRVTFDGRLCFSMFIRADEGTYYCSASNIIQGGSGSSQKLSGGFYLEVLSNTRPESSSPPTPGVVVEDRVALLGESVLLECFFFGKEPPSYQWSRKNGQLSSKSQTNNNNQDLKISDVELEDAGDYECTASNDVDQNKKITGTVSVKVPPQLIKELTDIKADIYSKATLECEASSPDVPMYEWYRNTELLTSRARHTFSNNQKTLKIVGLTVEDTAMFQCVAKNDFGVAYSTGQLTVRAIEPTFDPPGVPLITNQPAPRKGTVIIKCEPDAAPQPDYEWFKGEDKISTGGRFTIMENGNLEISNVNDDDGGSYRCEATNSMGKAESTGSLDIKDGTSIQEHPEEDTITMGTDYTLRCSATSDEIFELAYIWMKGDTQIDVVDDEHYEMDGGNLVIKDVQLRHAGTYTCVAQTVVDRAETEAKISVMGPPDPPINIAVELNSDSNQINANVSWGAGFDNFSPISAYNVESRTNYMPEGVWKEERNLILGTAKWAHLNGLSAWSTYKFRVIAQNELGVGEPSQASAEVETPARKPSVSPENVRGCCGGIGNLKIEWDPLHEQDWNGPNLRYKIEWTDTEGNPYVKQADAETLDAVTHHLVTGVPAYTKYFVRVSAKNDEGDGVWSPPAEVFSFQELPEEAPTNVQGTGTSGSSIKVSWTGIDAASFQGVLSGYKVKYWKSSETIETSEVHRSPGESTSTEVAGLEFNTNYKFVVVAYNGDNENGPPSTEASAKSLRNAPTAVPGNLIVKAKDKNSVAVKWDAITTSSTEEPLSGYHVLYWKDGQHEKDAMVKEAAATATTLTISELDKKENYFFKVRGYSAGGEGPVQDAPTKLEPATAEQSTGDNGGSATRLDSIPVTFLFLLSLLLLLHQHL